MKVNVPPPVAGAGRSSIDGTDSLCLAVIRENGADVVIFDAAGIPRTFKYDGGDMRSLCFGTHGMILGDDLMTHCFDENGRHASPEEPCFCGEQRPHLHAHLQETCNSNHRGGSKHHHKKEPCCSHDHDHQHHHHHEHSQDNKHHHHHHHDSHEKHQEEKDDKDVVDDVKSDSAAIEKFASEILFPTDHNDSLYDAMAASSDDDSSCNNNKKVPMVNIGDISDKLPKVCNSKELSQYMKKEGKKGNQVLERKDSRRKVQKVKHVDHVDYLIHDPESNSLHLEHECDGCGGHDVHGSFRPVGNRRLRKRTRNSIRKSRGDDYGGGRGGFGGTMHHDDKNGIRMLFFEVSQRPFQILDFIHETFQTRSSSRVEAAKNIMPMPKPLQDMHNKRKAEARNPMMWLLPPELLPKPTSRNESDINSNKTTKTVVRSTLTCQGICCAAEIPAISSILSPQPGVEQVLINVTLKQVIVDHDPSVASAKKLEEVLNMNDFGAKIQRDGGIGIDINSQSGFGGMVCTTAGKQQGITENSNKTGAGGKGRSQFHVKQICCASEIPAINKIVKPIQGVSDVSINTTTKIVYVDHDTSIVSAYFIANALNEEGFGAEIRYDAAATSTMSTTKFNFVESLLKFDSDQPPDISKLTRLLKTSYDTTQIESFSIDSKTISIKHHPLNLSPDAIAKALEMSTGVKITVKRNGVKIETWWKAGSNDVIPDRSTSTPQGEGNQHENGLIGGLKFSVVLSGMFWSLSMLSYYEPWVYLKYVALVSIAFGLPPIASKAYKTLRRFQFDTNCLMLTAAVGAVALGEFTEAAAVVFLFAISEWLEVRATYRARQALSAIVQLRPDSANLMHPYTQELIVIPASAVPVGALVTVKTGDKVPCDGVVVEGSSHVDESSLTGESRPISKGPKDKVSGGTVNSGMSPITVRTTATSENSAVSKLIRLVEEAQANRSETEAIMDGFARIYTPVIVFIAFWMCTIPWAFGPTIGASWTYSGLILIVVACPCALIISTPVSYVAGLAATAQKGVLIKGGAILEALGQTRHVFFDKTGTLTNGEFALLGLKILKNDISRNEVFQYLSLMEERASHPVAQAILSAARNESVVVPMDMAVEKHAILPGEGVSGVIRGKKVHVGNERLFERLGLLSAVSEGNRKIVEHWRSLGGTVGYMSIEGLGIVCSYCVADGVRGESAAVVADLKEKGMTVTMLTGDNEDAAISVASQIGLHIKEVRSKLLPQDKLSYIEKLTSTRTKPKILFNNEKDRELVLFCGDGVNDALALTAADVGVAMGEGAALAMETADVTLMDSNLEKLLFSLEMGRRVNDKIIQNVVFSLIVKAIVLILAIAGITSLWAAIVSDVGAMILVTLNSMTLLPSRSDSPEYARFGTNDDAEIGMSNDLDPDNPVTEVTPLLDAREDGHTHSHEHSSSSNSKCGHSHDHGHKHEHSSSGNQSFNSNEASTSCGHSHDHGHKPEHSSCGNQSSNSNEASTNGHGHSHDHRHKRDYGSSKSHEHSSCCGHKH